jgi:acetyl-CoA C-acetyltransferase
MVSSHSSVPVIVAAKRTPIGSFQGCLSSFKGYQLGSAVIKSLDLSCAVDEVIMGCVLQAAQGQAPARQAAIHAGIKDSAPCTTVNKVCGSGMKAIFMGCDQIRLNQASLVIAGGMESMTNAPYLLDRARGGYRAGHGTFIDHLYRDGLEDPYHKNEDGTYRLMGEFADDTASLYNFHRTQQEQYVFETLAYYQQALAKGLFEFEMTPLEVPDNKGNVTIITQDEPPSRVKPEKFSALNPAFRAGGTVTAATSSPLSDGAAAIGLASSALASEKGLIPLAKVVGYCSYAHQPAHFTTAPVGVIKKLCNQIGWSVADVDLFEVNEAFALVSMVVMKDLGIPREKMNCHGGACVLGHPIGSSGARIVVTLVHALIQKGLKRGIAAICIGGGESTAIAVEVV